MFRSSCAQPIDLQLGYGGEEGEDSAKINCANYQIWGIYWGMLSLVKSLAGDTAAWAALFQNTMSRTLEAHRRFSGQGVAEEVVCLTMDASPGLIGVAGWRNRDYLRLDASRLCKNLKTRKDDRPE